MPGEIQKIRTQIIDRIIIISVYFLLLPYLGSVSRITSIGWHNIYIIHTVLYIVIILLAWKRKKLKVNFKTTIIVGVYAFAGIAGLYSFGFSSVHYFLIIAVALLAILYNDKIVYTTVFILLSIYILIGILYVNGIISPKVDLNDFSKSPNQWVTVISSIIAFSMVFVLGLRKFFILLSKTIKEKDIISKKLEMQSIKYLKQKQIAEKHDNLKSAFLANMSHEIRTPMNAIIGFSQFLKDRKKSREELDRYAEIIEKSGNHLLNLINDIIDISKIDAGQANTFYEDIELNSVINEVYNIFKSQLNVTKNTGLKITKVIPDEELFIKSDVTRLRQILINLVGNAVKFTRKGMVEFGYETKEKEILFYVKDTGMGIPLSSQDEIFKRFIQAKRSTEKLYGGTGLGLSIAKACTEMLNGKIWFESEEGIGTTFYFTIELLRSNFNIENDNEIDIKKLTFNGQNILIAEDNDLNYKYLNEVLGNYNLNLRRTITGEETIEKVLQNHEIELLLLDIQLPQINGWDVVKILRKKGVKIPIVAQTAYAFETDKQESIEVGCDAYIAKPIAPDKLLKIIYNLLNQ